MLLLWRFRNVCDEESGEDSHGFRGIMYGHDVQEPSEHSDSYDMFIGSQDGSDMLSPAFCLS